MARLYTGPKNANTRCVPKSPSIRISTTSMLMRIKPAYTMIWSMPGIGLTTILLCPRATRNICFQRAAGLSFSFKSFPNKMLRRIKPTRLVKNQMAVPKSKAKMICEMNAIRCESRKKGPNSGETLKKQHCE